MTTVADVLNGAAALIDRRGWTQGNTALANERTGGPTCANLAISYVSPDDGVASQASNAMKSFLHTRSVVVWNDTPGRTHAEVVAALRAAAERAS